MKNVQQILECSVRFPFLNLLNDFNSFVIIRVFARKAAESLCRRVITRTIILIKLYLIFLLSLIRKVRVSP